MSGFGSSYSSAIGATIGGASVGVGQSATANASTTGAMSGASMAAGVGLMIGSLIGGAIARRKAKRRAEQSMRRGQISLPTPVTARRRVYGETRVAGDLKYWTTHGPDQEFVSLVYLLADHECESIVDVQFDNVSIGPLDGNGDVQDGSPWYRNTQFPNAQNLAATAGSITLPSATVAMPTISVLRSFVPDAYVALGSNDSGFVELTPGVHFTHTVGSTGITLAGSLSGVTLQAAECVVNWTSATGVALARVRSVVSGDVPATADATLITDSGGEWTSTCRLDGQTYLIVRLRWDERIGAGRWPVVHVVLRGAKVYDPRTDTTAWSANWALCIADYAKHVTGCAWSDFVAFDLEDSADTSDELVQAGPAKMVTAITKATQGVATIPGHGFLPGDLLRFTVTGMTGVNGQDIAIVRIIDASTVVLDENTSGYGTFSAGTVIAKVRRYQIHGEVLSTADPKDVLEDMALAGAGAIAPSAGRIRVLCGKYRAPVSITLSDGDLAGPAISYLPFPSEEDTFNTASGRFFDSRLVGGTRIFSETTYATYQDAAYLAEDLGEEISRTIDQPFVVDYRIANRLAKVLMHRGRQGARFMAPYKLRALPLEPGDVVELGHARYGFPPKEFEVHRVIYAFPNVVVIEGVETSEAIWDDDYSAAAFVDPAPNTMLASATDLDRPILSVHASATEAPITIDTLADGSRVPYVLVSWPARANAAEFVSIRWKRSFETAYRTADSRPGETSMKLVGPSGGDVLQILGYAINSINARSDPWVIQEFHVDSRLPRYNGVIPALSANLLKNATLEVSGQNWSTFEIGIGSGVSTFGKWADTAGVVPGVPSSCVLVINSTLTGDGYTGAAQSEPFSVVPGTLYAGYAGLIGYATDAYVALVWFDAAGQQLGSPQPGTVIAGGMVSAAGYWNRPENYDLSFVSAAAPTGAVTGRLVIYGTGNWQSAPAKAVSVHRPFAGEIPVGSVDVPVWHPGGSNIVDNSAIAPGATRRLDASSAVLSGFIPSVPKNALVQVGSAAYIEGDFDGTGLSVLVTVTGNVEQLSDGSGAPIEVRGVISAAGVSREDAPERVLTYLATTPVAPAQILQKAGFEISHRFTLPAPLPGTGIRYAFTFSAKAPTGTVVSVITFQNVNITFDIAR